MEVVYKAFDGTEFSKAEQCQNYEENLKKKIVVTFTFRSGNKQILEYYSIGEAKRDIARYVKQVDPEHNYPNMNKVEVITKGIKHGLYFHELLEYVPAHYKIKGKELDKLFLVI